MDDLEGVLARLDPVTAARARPALQSLLAPAAVRGSPRSLASLTPTVLGDLLTQAIAGWPGAATDRHEAAWALADFFDAAGLPELASVCRAAETHAALATPTRPAVRPERAAAWAAGLRRGRPELWDEVLPLVRRAPLLPTRLELALVPVRALLDAVGDGVPLTAAGYLPPRLALALDARFGWSDELSAGRPRGEGDLPALLFLHEHLREQRLLAVADKVLVPAAQVARLTTAPDRLWAAVVAARPRWRSGFERDALAVMAATLLRGHELTRDQLREEMAFLLSGKWRRTGAHTVQDGVRAVELGWFRVGYTLGWWDREGGLWSAKVGLSGFGRAAAASLFWSAV